MKISEVALALFANEVSKGGEAIRDLRNTAETAFKRAEMFMDVRDGFLAANPQYDEGDGNPR